MMDIRNWLRQSSQMKEKESNVPDDLRTKEPAQVKLESFPRHRFSVQKNVNLIANGSWEESGWSNRLLHIATVLFSMSKVLCWVQC